MPLNELREKIVLEKLHLLLEEDRQKGMPALEQVVAHVSWCRAMIAKWKRDKDKPWFKANELYSPIEFPRDLEARLADAVAELQRQQAALLQSLEPAPDSGLIRLGLR